MPAEGVSRRWRRFLRFSVRGLIVVVLLLGGWLGWIVRSARVQRDAVAAIKPTFVVIDSFSTAARARVTPVEDTASLQRLRTPEPSIPGAVLAHLIDLPKLSILKLSGHQVTDDELIHLKGLTNLSNLDLVSTRITGAGLVHLKALDRLSKLCIHDSPLTDDALANLKNLTGLSSLSLAGTHISDAGLAHPTGLIDLSELRLSDTQVTDAGVRRLQEALPSLKIKR